MEALRRARTRVVPIAPRAPATRDVVDALARDAWWGNVTDGVERRDDARASTRDVSTRVGPSVSVLCRMYARTTEAAVKASTCVWEEIALDFLEVHGLQKAARGARRR